MMNQTCFQLECLARIHGRLIARHVDYRKTDTSGSQRSHMSFGAKECHKSISGAVSAGSTQGNSAASSLVLVVTKPAIALRVLDGFKVPMGPGRFVKLAVCTT
jgi:hypothetical protein